MTLKSGWNTGLVVLIKKVIVCTTKVYLFEREREGWNFFKWEKCKDKDLNVAVGKGLCYVKWLKNEIGQGFIFHAIISAHYTFWRKFFN